MMFICVVLKYCVCEVPWEEENNGRRNKRKKNISGEY